LSEPKKKNTKAWTEWSLRHNYYYNVTLLASSIARGLDLVVLRQYLDCLEKGESGEEPSALLMEKHHFNTMSIWAAFKNKLGLNDLRKYLDYMEEEMRSR
jgi:hypothetical protein